MSFVRKLNNRQQCEVHLYDVITGEDRLVFSTKELLLEAPNWHKDGYLLLNGDGLLWKLNIENAVGLEHIDIHGLPEINNDHVLSPDQQNIYLSTYDDWQIYRAPIGGGLAVQVTPEEPGVMYFLHGVSPDESQLAYVRIKHDEENAFSDGRIHLIDLATGQDRALVNGNGAEDGSEYSFDGGWVYFNTEHFSTRTGHAQIARVRCDGSNFEQLTFDERVNWFPHQSADGKYWVYLSFPSGTEGHPADLPVELKLVSNENWSRAQVVSAFNGGQGTINVNSWSPTSPKFAFVTYPNID
ncbi:MAG: TolB family protein [Micrococcales bacterium]